MENVKRISADIPADLHQAARITGAERGLFALKSIMEAALRFWVHCYGGERPLRETALATAAWFRGNDEIDSDDALGTARLLEEIFRDEE